MGEGLKTQDRMRQWDVATNINLVDLKCVFCLSQADSHSHFFFECSFSMAVWNKVKVISNLSHVNSKWHDLVSALISLSKRNVLSNIIVRLSLCVTAYYIWQERNLRNHKKVARTYEQVYKVIFETVRCKILSLRYKEMGDVKKFF